MRTGSILLELDLISIALIAMAAFGTPVSHASGGSGGTVRMARAAPIGTCTIPGTDRGRWIAAREFGWL